jgi:C-methyltransferase
MQLLGTPVMWQGYERLAEAVRGGGTVLGEHAEVPDFTLWKRFAQHTTGVAAQGGRALTKLLSERLAASAELRVLDVACGTGLYGLTVAREFPRASLTCLDWEHVLAYTRTHAERLGVAERVTYVPGDMFNVELGGPYDLVIASHVFHHFDDQRSSMLLRRLARVTRPGGLMAVHDFMITNDPPAADPAPYLFATTMLMSTRHGDTYTVERYARLLEGAGFGAPQERTLPRMPTRFLFAERSRNE